MWWFIGIATLAMLPLLLLMTRPRKVSLVPAH